MATDGTWRFELSPLAYRLAFIFFFQYLRPSYNVYPCVAQRLRGTSLGTETLWSDTVI